MMKRSSVWKHFSAEKDHKVNCLICGQKLSVAKCSTTGLIRHMRTSHYSKFNQFQPIARKSQNELFEDSYDSSLDEEEKDNKRIESFDYDEVKLYGANMQGKRTVILEVKKDPSAEEHSEITNGAAGANYEVPLMDIEQEITSHILLR